MGKMAKWQSGKSREAGFRYTETAKQQLPSCRLALLPFFPSTFA